MNVLEPAPKNAGRRLLVALAVLVLCALVPLGLGLAEPRMHRARHERSIAAPRAEVYGLLARVGEWNRWNPDVGELVPLGDGRFESHPNDRTRLVYLLVHAHPDDRLVVRLEPTPRKFGATWTFELVDEGASTRLRMREEGFVESAALRFVMRYLVGYDVALVGLAEALEDHLRRHAQDAGADSLRGTSPP